MKKIGFYTRHKLQNYSLALSTEMAKKFDVFVFSEDNLHDDRILNTEVFFNYAGAIDNFSDAEINDIIRRCRVLRSLKVELALWLIRRANLSISGMLFYNCPDVIISPRIDDYYLDILQRICERRGIQFIGMWRSAFQKSKFLITSRGEFNKLRNPDYLEVQEFLCAINNDAFKATSISTVRFEKLEAFSRYIKLYIRALALELIRRFSSNKFRYRELATRFFVNEYRVCVGDILSSFNCTNSEISEFLARKRPRVFIALQVNPESTIDYYCNNLDFISIPDVLPLLVKSFIKSGFDVIIKDHPNMIGNRRMSLFNDLHIFGKNLLIAPASTHSTFLIKNSEMVFTWSGTVAVQAVIMKRKAICVCVPYFLKMNGFYRINSINDLDNLLSSVDFHNDSHASEEQILCLSEHILSSHMPGDIYTHNNQPLGDYKAVSSFLSGFID